MKASNILIVLCASFMFTSCGKKKEAAKSEAAPAPTSTAAEAPKPPQAPKAEDKKADKSGDSKSTDKTRTPKKEKETAAKPSVPGAKDKKADSKSKKAAKKEVVVKDMQLTGGASKSGLLYTGTSDDSILAQLVREENLKSEAEFNKNAVLAASIWEAAYLVDRDGFLTIDIQIKKNDSHTRTSMKTQFEAGQVMIASANVGSAQELSVEAECLDYFIHARRCSNLLVTLTQKGAQATVLLRQTTANIDFDFERSQLDNEYGTFLQFFKNAEKNSDSANRLQNAYLHTFEVVNGKSGFKGIITGKKGQVIVLTSDLLIKKSGETAGIQVLKETQMADVDLWMGRVVGADLGLSKMISAALLTGNNSKGEISVDVVVDSKSTQSKNTMNIKFIRKSVQAIL